VKGPGAEELTCASAARSLANAPDTNVAVMNDPDFLIGIGRAAAGE
jgi:hypothetical protein